jgi:hypothetical protein
VSFRRAEDIFCRNLRHRAKGELQGNEWARDWADWGIATQEEKTKAEKEGEKTKAEKKGEKTKAEKEGRRIPPHGLPLPPIRDDTRALLMRPPEPDASLAGYLIAVINVLYVISTFFDIDRQICCFSNRRVRYY